MILRRFPIKARLTLATLIPLVVAIVSCWLVGVVVLTNRIVAQAQDKVRNDLNAARESYRHELETIRDVVRFSATVPSMAPAIARGDRQSLAALLVPLLKNERLDILTAVDPSGRVVYRAATPDTSGDRLEDNPFVRRALAGETVLGSDVIPSRRLAVEGEGLLRRAAVPLLPTPHARQRPEEVERSGMVLTAAVPVRDPGGQVVGALYAGVLLNNNNRLVDRIRGIVFGSTGESATGTSTLFLGDLRIATNVKLPDGKRAIGTRMSEEVHDRVLLRGETWFGRAFVVNDWYYSAYEPILSPAGVPIGALYVGLPERPYTAIKLRLGILYSVVLLVGASLGLLVSQRLGSRLAAPIRELEQLARRVAAGERGIRIEATTPDEIGDLAAEFNAMTVALGEREEEISALNRGLEEKVRERTAALEEQGRQLLATREELHRAEKLAAVGELAAGVAHEINNPLAIIRGNAELLEMDLPADSPSREEVAIITRQAGRIGRIVSGLLRFARHEERRLERVGLHAIIDDVLAGIGHQVPLEGVAIVREYDPALPEITADGDQLRQLFTNLAVNAVQAMPGGGTLTVTTRFDRAAGSCTVTLADTGGGIPPERLSRVFDPFYTTKGNGTGLGLAVSYGIVREHGGSITAASLPGSGTIFTVILPCRPPGPATEPS